MQLARGIAALGSSRPAEAFAALARMFDPADGVYHRPQSSWAIDYLADAAALTGQRAWAREALQVVELETDGSPAPGVRRAVALARLLLAEDRDVESAATAARDLARAGTPWYRARVDLATGAWLRRERRISESRDPLAAAQAVFQAIGARAWASRAGEELAATGLRPRNRAPEAWAQLSAQELQIARLAAAGLTNREIGQRLYLSHRTVASHLYRAYPKLGVTSRTQLIHALGRATG